MTDIATQLLATFETLPRNEQHELLAQMLRRTGELPDTPMGDVDLSAVADQLLQSLDAEETDGDAPNKR